jgi:hypothetical protein
MFIIEQPCFTLAIDAHSPPVCTEVPIFGHPMCLILALNATQTFSWSKFCTAIVPITQWLQHPDAYA